MGGINGNWRLPCPPFPSANSTDVICRKCFQVGHTSSGCRVWIHWGAYHRQQQQHFPSQSKCASEAPLYSSPHPPTTAIDLYLETNESHYDADEEDSFENEVGCKDNEDLESEDSVKEDNECEEDVNEDSAEDLALEGVVPLSDLRLYVDNDESDSNDTINEAAASLDALSRSPAAKTIYCYNCGLDFHTMEQCTYPSNYILVHKKLTTVGPWDDDLWYSEEDLQEEKDPPDDQLVFVDDHFA